MKFSNQKPTIAEAEQMASRIVRYWAERGQKVKAWVEVGDLKAQVQDHYIRSDMVNGFPRHYKRPFKMKTITAEGYVRADAATSH